MSLESKPKQNDREILFNETKKQVTAILEPLKCLEIAEGRLYFVDGDTVALLTELKSQLEGSFTKKTDPKRFGFDLICRILNPNKPAQKYSVGVKGKHRQINDSEKVRANIEGEFAVFSNKLRKEAREKAVLHNMKDDEIAQLEKETTKRIMEAEAGFKFVMDNFDKLEVRIAGYAHEKIYPYVSYVVNGKQHNTHVSIKVPTILYYESVKYRSDMDVADFISHARNAFGDVFFMEKE